MTPLRFAQLMVGAALAMVSKDLIAQEASLATVPLDRHQMNLSFSPVVKKVAPAVVNIYATRMIKTSPLPPIFADPIFRQFFGDSLPFEKAQTQVQSSLGSGVIVKPNGIIVTNYHVIKYAEEIKVVLQDGREFEATVEVKDKRTDLAIVKLKGSPADLPYLEFRDADSLEVGDIVFAFGNPFGFGHTVTSGIVSALARNEVGIADFRSLIQTDAAINPGNSGGPLVTLDGRIVGINTSIFSNTGGSIGIGFAIPSNLVLPIMNSLNYGGEIRRAWVGAAVTSVTYEMAQALGLSKPGGVLIHKIVPHSPAAKANFHVGDVILKLDGHEILNESAYRFRLAVFPVGAKITAEILRNGKVLEMPLTLEKAPTDSGAKKVKVGGRNPLSGCVVMALNAPIANELGLEGDPEGLVIVGITQGTPAAFTGLLPGDVIKKVNGSEIITPEDLTKGLERSRTGWEIQFERNGKQQTLAIRNW